MMNMLMTVYLDINICKNCNKKLTLSFVSSEMYVVNVDILKKYAPI